MEAPETRYARSDDVAIAYQVFGEGPFDLVWTPGALSHLDLAWEDEAKARFLHALAAFSRVITFDKRGTGLSDRVARLADLETRMDDIRAVMDAARSETAALCGVSEGGPMALLFAATYPERVQALVNYGSLPRFVRVRTFPGRSQSMSTSRSGKKTRRFGARRNTRAPGSRANGLRQLPRRSVCARARTGCASARARCCN